MSRNELDDWLAAARADLSQRAPDLLLEQRVLSRVREKIALQSIAETCERLAAPPRRANGRRVFSRFAFAFAVAVVMVIGVAVIAPNAPRRDAVSGRPFFALVASEAMAAESSAQVVASQVSGAALVDYGLPVDPSRVDQPIGAEFLVSPTGMVLAVRFTE